MTDKPSQSIKSDRISESSIARMAGNIAAGLVGHPSATVHDEADLTWTVRTAVHIARAIAAEVERTKQE